jgi:uncharacterized protein
VFRIFAVCCLLWGVTASAADLQFPPLTGRVVDAAALLDEARKATLTQRLADHEAATTEQLVVATVPSLEGRTIEEYANLLFREWGLGQREANNGVLLLVAPNERKVRIEVGYGLEGRLTDLLAADIIQRRIVPRFKEGDYAAGVEGGVAGILGVLTGEAADEAEPQQVGPSLDSDAFAPGLFLLIIASAVSNLLFQRRYLAARAAVFGIAGAGFGWWMTHLIPVAAFFALFAALFAVGNGSGGGSGSGSRSGGGSSGGGGFSGGGGSSGGGGASGSW